MKRCHSSRQSFMILLLVAMLGCATNQADRIPPPRIVNDYYINPQYAFLLEIPQGWQVTEQIPPWHKVSLSEEQQRDIKKVFTKISTSGIVVIGSSEAYFSLIPGRNNSVAHDVLRNQLEEYFTQRSKQMSRTQYITRYEYDIFNQVKYFEYIDIDNGVNTIRIVNLGIFYNFNQKLYEIHIYLISDMKRFDVNYKVYEKVVESLKTGDSMRSKVIADRSFYYPSDPGD